MLSISLVKSAKAAKSYFNPEQYYQKGDALGEQTAWFGEGAAALGLEGTVDIERFAELLEGKVGDTQLGQKRGGEHKHQCGWDLTFSAPKSVSILALLGGDERLVQAHQTAVETALKVVEKELIKTRRRLSRKEVVEVATGNMVTARFLHSLSRENDPQLHTHCVTVNATQREDEQWCSLNSINFYENKMLVGQIYRNKLALLIKKLGYQLDIDYRSGLFEIRGLSEDALLQFSKRREQVKEAASSPDARSMEQATLATRKEKYRQSPETVRQQWEQECQVIDLGSETCARLVQHARDNIPDDTVAPSRDGREAWHAVKHLASREAVFTTRQLRNAALKLGLGEIGHEVVDRDVQQQLAAGEIVPSSLAVKGRVAASYTTPSAYAKERYILKLLEQGKEARVKLTHKWKVVKHLKGSGLTTGQQEAIQLVATTKDQFVGVQGFAGVGKTTMLRCLKPLIEASGYQVLACAPTHTAVDALREETGIQSRTLASFLQAMGKKQDGGKAIDASKEVWIVDEASLIGTKAMADLLTCARATRSRVVLLGDKAQLGAVSWGKPFHLMMSHGMRCATMREIQRQKAQWLKEAVEKSIRATRYLINWPRVDRDPTEALKKQIALSGEDIQQALAKLRGNLYEIPSKEQRQEMLAACYAGLSHEERERTMVIIPDNRTRHALMPALRQAALQGQKHKKEPADKTLETTVFCEVDCPSHALAQCYAPGEVVEFSKTYRKMGIKAGDRFYVEKVDGKLNQVTLTPHEQREGEKKLLIWNPGEVAGNSKQAVAVFEEYHRDMVIGEKIIFNKGNRKIGVKNGDIAVVTAIDYANRVITAQPASGGKVTFNCDEFRQFDHAYAITAYKSQGKTVDRVFVLAESYREGLITQKSFYVSLSRAKFQAKIFTDSIERLSQGLAERPGHKSSALEQAKMSEAVDKIAEKNRQALTALARKTATTSPITMDFDLSV